MNGTKPSRLAVFVACTVALLSCDHRSPTSTTTDAGTSRAPEVIETQWTDAAAKRTAKEISFVLPELRIYDKRQQLIFQQSGINHETVTETIQAAIKTDRPVAGPSYSATVADVQTGDGSPASSVIRPSDVTIFDYWASWCAPCKILEKQLFAWTAQQPPGSVKIVRVEADLTKLEKATGEKVYLLKKGPDGKLARVEMK